jgi:hypothetical protein
VAEGRNEAGIRDPVGRSDWMILGNGRREGRVGASPAKVESPAKDGVLRVRSVDSSSTDMTHSHVACPRIPIPSFAVGAATFGVKNPPPPLPASGLSCLRPAINPGISEAELRGIGLGDRVGKRVWGCDCVWLWRGREEDAFGGSGKILSGSGRYPAYISD